jgi:hypothetical protein
MATEAARLGRNPQEGKRKQKEKTSLIRKKKKNILDTHRPSHGRHLNAELFFFLQ